RGAAADIRDLTGPDLRNAILALAAADAAISNDSGLLHVAAALGTPTIGIFGPTSPWHWAPLNPIAAVIETTSELPCRPCHKPTCRLRHHRCMRDISVEQVPVAAGDAPATLARTQLRAQPYSSRRSAAMTSATDGNLSLPPTIAIGPRPIGPVKPGSLPAKMATNGTPSAAARCTSPVSTPTTKDAPATNRNMRSSGCLSGTLASTKAAARRSLRTRSASVPQGSRSNLPPAVSSRPSAIQDASGHSFSGRAVE